MTYYQQCMFKTRDLFGDSLVFYIIYRYKIKIRAEQIEFVKDTINSIKSYGINHSTAIPLKLIDKLEKINTTLKNNII